MDKLDRAHQLHRLLAARREAISSADLQSLLDCSRATLMRDIEWLRDMMGAPIEYDRDQNGYFYDRSRGDFELPGLWLNAQELQSLLSMNQLLSNLQHGVLDDLIGPVRDRIEKLLQTRQLAGPSLAAKVKLKPLNARRMPEQTYQMVVQALAHGTRIQTLYEARRGASAEVREISPQRLVHYRDNWYCDAWCHNRNGLRSFSLDRMREVTLLSSPAQSLSEEQLNAHYASSYGIFNGSASEIAVLRFSAHAAQWVADEIWHPDQTTHWLDDGRFELSIPYHESPELVGEIMRWMPDVQVVAPMKLKDKITAILKEGLDQHAA
jgi:predicted DNA-binding transcriptional regulator YafY